MHAHTCAPCVSAHIVPLSFKASRMVALALPPPPPEVSHARPHLCQRTDRAHQLYRVRNNVCSAGSRIKSAHCRHVHACG
eukprot:365703-Chlamydomonas_euryale.AAC.5